MSNTTEPTVEYNLQEDIRKHIEWANIRLDLMDSKLTNFQEFQMELIIKLIVKNALKNATNTIKK